MHVALPCPCRSVRISAWWPSPIFSCLAYFSAAWCLLLTSVCLPAWSPQHLGRLLASMCAVFGILAASLLASSLRNALQWSTDESSVAILLDREKDKLWFREQAARVIQMWWLEQKKTTLSILLHRRLTQARLQFGYAREHRGEETNIDIDEMDSSTAKINTMNADSRYVCNGVDLITKTMYIAQGNGWVAPQDEFNMVLDDTKAMTDVQKHLFDRILSQRMMAAQAASMATGRRFSISEAATNVVRIKQTLRLTKARRVVVRARDCHGQSVPRFACTIDAPRLPLIVRLSI